VLHPGAHMGQGEQKGIFRIADGINTVLGRLPEIRTRLLLETTAGQGSSLGHTFEQLAAMIDRVEQKKRIGVCLDTAHIFAAGYDIRSEKSYDETLSAFDSVIGLDHLHLIHVNDSKKPFGSRVDRHAHIGFGSIGAAAFMRLMIDPRLTEIPKIIETPKEGDGKDWDRANLGRLMEMARRAAA
jgi:deoxyribonuclease IV